MLNYNKLFSKNPFSVNQKTKNGWFFKDQKKLSIYHYKQCIEYKKIADKIFTNLNNDDMRIISLKLNEINDVEGTEYLFHDGDTKEPDLGKQSLQCGRRVDALKLWLTWKYFGNAGYEKKIDHLFEMAKYAGQKVKKSKILKHVSDVFYLNICFQIQPDGIGHSQAGRFTVAVRDELLKNAHAMVNYAEVEGRECMRLITANYELKKEHIDTQKSCQAYVKAMS